MATAWFRCTIVGLRPTGAASSAPTFKRTARCAARTAPDGPPHPHQAPDVDPIDVPGHINRLFHGAVRPGRPGADHGRRATHQRGEPGQYPGGVSAGPAAVDAVP